MAEKLVALFDAVNYVRKNELANRTEHVTLRRGDAVPDEVTEADRARLLEAGAIGPASALTDPAGAPAAPGGLKSDDELEGLNADDTLAYVGQHPEEADRVLDLEHGRDRPRKGVIEGIESLQAAGSSA